VAKGYQLSREKDGTIRLSGQLSLPQVPLFLKEMERIFHEENQASFKIDLTDLEGVDSAGALALAQLEETGKAIIKGMTEEVRRVFELIDRDTIHQPPLHEAEQRTPLFESVGALCIKMAYDFVTLMTFAGELIISLPYCLFHPRSLRWNDIFRNMKRTGVDALPIVGLLSLLIGLIMAFMSSLQLKQLGANIYVASLVGIAIIKELGPMMTAIIVAGRSGSAFAAEIGTMIVNEEVDALTTMGFHPIRFLAIPKIIATAIVVPLLTLYAMMFGILGGLIVGIIGLDITLTTYLRESLRVVDVWDVTTSLIKAFTFALLIAGVGCHRGFQVSGGAEAVGEATTSAVVTSIFLIIVADAAYAVILHYIG
jgi:phospholipid/cholesterol/gamma-HCH transport system permease protein